jgi:hypothetical protein
MRNMQELFFNQRITKFSVSFLLAAALAVLAGCSDITSSGTGTGTGGGTGGGTTTTEPSLMVVLVSNSISSGTSTTVNATVKDATGAAVPNIVVTFSTDSTMAAMTPSSGTALTNGSGVASITLTGGANLGATTITANAQVGTTAVTGSSGFTVGAVAVSISSIVFGANPLSAFGTTSVTATVTGGGTTSQTVNFSSICSSTGKAVLSTGIATVAGVATASYRDNGCASTDTITASISGGLATNTATLDVTPPTTGSIQYVSSLPTNISLKGTGGTEVSQVTFKVLDTGGNPLSGKLVTFGLSTTVGGIILTPNTGVAPFAIGTATSGSDGTVVTNVNAGTVSTPVRVTASTVGAGGVSLTTQSSQLTITTGIPDQYGFSLAATKWNIEGLHLDGTTSVLTVHMADHFKNPVPDGTAVVFTAESGTIIGSCNAIAGSCSSTYTSSGTRPTNGRATVLAYAVGEETFTDLNGSGWADLTPNEMVDSQGNPTDMPEAFVDYNENGVFDPATETFIDYNLDGIYNPADGKIAAVLCDDVTAGRSSAGSCSSKHTIHVRDVGVMVLSSSFANITINGEAFATADTTSASATLTNVNVLVGTLAVGQALTGAGIPAGTTIIAIALPNVTMSANATASVSGDAVKATGFPVSPIVLTPCDDGVGPPAHVAQGNVPSSFIVTVVDENGNAMPAGTTIAFSSDNGLITSPISDIVGSTIACRLSTNPITGLPDYPGCPASAGIDTFGDYLVTMKSDAVFTPVAAPNPAKCANSSPSGTFTVTVTTATNPAATNGVSTTTATATVND